MKLLFITVAYPKGSEEYLQQLNGGIPLAIPSNTYQWAVIDGLNKNQVDFEVVSLPSLCSYPFHFKKLFSPEMEMSLDGKQIGTMLRSLRLKYLSGLAGRRSLYCYIRDWVNRYQQEDKLVVLVYSPDSDLIRPIIPVKRAHNNLKVCTIVTDLPDDYNNPMFKLSGFRRWINARKEKMDKSCYAVADSFVLLSKAMEEKIPSAVGHDIIIEGICPGLPPLVEKEPSEIKTLLYTGSLGVHTSVDHLVNAFMATNNQSFRLIICGSGELENYITEKSAEDNRIIFKGMLPRNEALILQKQATAVINPRKPSVSITRYSFPSKTMEYMSSGTPLIGYKLEGIPSEYYQYYFTIEDESVKTLSDTINKVLALPQQELNTMAKDAYLFMKESKSAKKQIERLIKFL